MSRTTEQDRRPVLRYLRLPDVKERTRLSRSVIYEKMADGTFPRPRRISRGLVAWPEHVIVEWMTDRPVAGPEPEGEG